MSEAIGEGWLRDEARDAATGADAIAGFVRRLPNRPGVYRMLDAEDNVLYVGKARSLKKRVTSYAQGRGHSERILRMIALTRTMEFIVTRSEIEALLLEANLIKRLRPRFNVLLRDDKSYPYILVTDDHPAPGLFKHRGARTHKGRYYGPFASAGAVTRTINALQRAFLIRTCSDSFYENRTRPCLLYQIKRCSAPCTGEIDLDSYGRLVAETNDFLSGRSDKVRAALASEMQAASDRLDFERAAMLRDRLAALSLIQSHQGINTDAVTEADVFAMHQEGGQTAIEVFFFRTGQNWGNRSYFPRADASVPPGELLATFLSQFYDDKPAPRLILLSHEPDEAELLAEALATRSDGRVEIAVPRRGGKRRLVEHALQNAREALGRRLAETSSQAQLLARLAETFGLPRVPRRIEVYDNSHIMGTNAVGAMVVAGPEGPVKNQYRKFNIRSSEITPGDDFAMMAEMIERRFARLIREHGLPGEAGEDAGRDSLPAWPDLILIDGGAGQLGRTLEVLDRLGIRDAVPVVAIAKGPDRDAGRERFFLPGRNPFSLPPRDPVLYFVQRLRDEAHRFAIGTHRARRRKEMTRNPLDEIPGIGPRRKRALLHHFGSAKAVARAAVADLMTVEGISEQMARHIHGFFHENG